MSKVIFIYINYRLIPKKRGKYFRIGEEKLMLKDANHAIDVQEREERGRSFIAPQFWRSSRKYIIHIYRKAFIYVRRARIAPPPPLSFAIMRWEVGGSK